MSTIGIGIQGSQYGTTIDVETMRDRLTTMRDRMQQEIDNGNTSEKLADRLDKVNSQIDRLGRLDGQNLTISADRAEAELEKGMKYLSEGMKFLQGEGATQGSDKLGRWFDHLDSVYRTIDRRG